VRALVAVGALCAGCSAGGAAAPHPGPRDASVDGGPADATTPPGESGSDDDGGDGSFVPIGYEGSIPYGGCAALGTCAPQPNVQLAGGQQSPAGIAIDDASVYWVNVGSAPLDGGARPGSQVMTCAKAGCNGSPTVLASGTWIGASKLGVDDSNVYWILTSSVLVCPLTGCVGDPQVVWSGTGPLYDIAVDATGAYFTSTGGGQLVRCPGVDCDGGGIIFPGAYGGTYAPSAVALDATSVYFVDEATGKVFACTKADCPDTVRVVASPTDAAVLAQLAVDDTNVYVTDIEQGRILFAPKGGMQQALAVLVDNLVSPVGLAADGTSVYYTDTGTPISGPLPDAAANLGRVAGCLAGGCGERGTAVAGFVNQPLDVAVDSTHVYWTDFGLSSNAAASDAGRVMAYAKRVAGSETGSDSGTDGGTAGDE
jgi:hypothetical protein